MPEREIARRLSADGVLWETVVVTEDSGGGGGGLFDAYAYLREQKPNGNHAGTPNADTWNTRVLNTIVYDSDGIVSLEASQFTLQPGSYWIVARAISVYGDRHKLKLRDWTAGADAAIGANANSASSSTDAWLHCRVSPAVETTYELQHWIDTSLADAGLGGATSASVVEVYAEVWIWREGSGGGGGGGGEVPSEWTTVIEGNNTLRYQVGDVGTWQLQVGADANTGVVLATGGDPVNPNASIQVESKGGGVSTISAWNHNNPNGEIVVIGGDGYINFFTVAGNKAIEAWDGPGNTLRFAILEEGHTMIGVTAAPADGDLQPSQLAFWFDDTNGSAKLMLKGKTANGTVVTGQVALA